MDTELDAFFERYIGAYNARDEAAFAECFNLPVTTFYPPPDDELGAGPLPVLTTEAELYALLPPPGDYSTIDSVGSLQDVAPFPMESPAPQLRPGIVATISRRDFSGRVHQRLQALFLLSRQDGRLAIKFVAQTALFEPSP